MKSSRKVLNSVRRNSEILLVRLLSLTWACCPSTTTWALQGGQTTTVWSKGTNLPLTTPTITITGTTSTSTKGSPTVNNSNKRITKLSTIAQCKTLLKTSSLWMTQLTNQFTRWIRLTTPTILREAQRPIGPMLVISRQIIGLQRHRIRMMNLLFQLVSRKIRNNMGKDPPLLELSRLRGMERRWSILKISWTWPWLRWWRTERSTHFTVAS